MAIFHSHVQTISRAKGRSATAAAAYRAGIVIADERTGEVHDYSKKQGVVFAAAYVPGGKGTDPVALWNAAEKAETRRNSTVAREWNLALPHELDQEAQVRLSQTFAAWLMKEYGVATMIAIHEPGKGGDERNTHLHVMATTRKWEEGKLGEKTRILDDRKSGSVEIEKLRNVWANLCNKALSRAGKAERIDSRSYAKQGINQLPTAHVGVAATAMERRGVRTERGELNRRIRLVNRKALEAARDRRQLRVEKASLVVEEEVRDAPKTLQAARREPISFEPLPISRSSHFRAERRAYRREKAIKAMMARRRRNDQERAARHSREMGNRPGQ